MKFKKFLGGMPQDPPSMRAPVGGGGEGGRERGGREGGREGGNLEGGRGWKEGRERGERRRGGKEGGGEAHT